MPIFQNTPNYPQDDKIDLFVEGCLAQMDAGAQWFVKRILPLSLDQLRWRSGIGAWSILDCLNHLHHTFEHHVPKIEQAIQQNPRKRGGLVLGIPFPESEEEFLRQNEPPIGSVIPTPPLLVRVPAASPDRIVDEYPQLRDRYSAAVRDAWELDLASIIVESSAHSPVQSLGGTLALLAAYDRWNIWWAERVRRAPAFPASMAGMQ